MANDEAWQTGWNQGQGKKNPKKMPKAVGQVTTSDGQTLYPTAMPKQFKKGGKVKKTGVALVHKNERVLTAKETKKYKKDSAKKRVASKG